MILDRMTNPRRRLLVALLALGVAGFAACTAPRPQILADGAMPAPDVGAQTLLAFHARLAVSRQQLPLILRSADDMAARVAAHPEAYLTVPYGDQCSFAEEILNRAGGLANPLPLEERPTPPTPHDILLFSVRSWEKDGEKARRHILRAASNGWAVVLFASRAGMPPDLPVDILLDNGASVGTEPEAAVNSLANILNVWLWQSEYAAALTRRGKAPGVLQSIMRPGEKEHNRLVTSNRCALAEVGTPIPAGRASAQYLEQVDQLLLRLSSAPTQGQIRRAARLLARHVRSGKQPAVATCTHFLMGEMQWDTRAPWKPINAVWRAQTAFQETLKAGDLLLWIGYVGFRTPYEDYGGAIRKCGTDFITCFVADPDPTGNAPDARVHIDQCWPDGDAVVDIPYPPGRMAPLSGLNVGLLFRMLDEEVARQLPRPPSP